MLILMALLAVVVVIVKRESLLNNVAHCKLVLIDSHHHCSRKGRGIDNVEKMIIDEAHRAFVSLGRIDDDDDQTAIC